MNSYSEKGQYNEGEGSRRLKLDDGRRKEERRCMKKKRETIYK